MKRIIFALSLLLTTALTINAVPAKRVSKTIIVDGKETLVTLKGDESCHYWEAEDGSKFGVTSNDTFERLSEATVKRLTSLPKKMTKATALTTTQDMTSSKARAKRAAQNTGEKHGLVILVNFKDKSFTSTSTPKETYENIVNGIDYKSSRNYGSVRDYFRAQSYGKLDFNFDIAGPVTLSQNMAYYGANDSDGNDLRPGTMVWEACNAINDEVDFSQYDNDGDGEVDQVYIVYAGYGEASGASSSTIWPHAWYLSEASKYESGIGSQTFDGVKVDSYACGCELTGTSGKTMDGIGTFCHEFSHCLGLPDFYCTDYNHDQLTMSYWSVMDTGCYCDYGYTPCSYTAYERWASGWTEPTELTTPTDITDMSNIDDEGECYILYNSGNTNEYFLLYNIQKKGWNSNAPGHGMLVLHVDYDQTEWAMNTPNNTSSHLRMTPVCADNSRSSSTLPGDPYPGTSYNTELTDNSKPAAKLFHANANGKYYMGKPITNIAETNGLISFTFDGGAAIPMPTGLTAYFADGTITADLDSQSIQSNYTYNIKYGALNENEQEETTLMDEDFAKCTASSDGNQDISESLDSYFNIQGCTGNKLYKGTKGMKVSSSKENGYLRTPLLTTSGEKIKLTISTAKYSSDAASFTVTVYNANGAEIHKTAAITAGTQEEIELEVPQTFSLQLSATKRFYFEKLVITGGGNKYSQETVINNITALPYSFTPEMEANNYWLTMQAIANNGKTSDWTPIIIVENTTGIKDIQQFVEAEKTAFSRKPSYNLAGQRIDSSYKGIVIINGKKTIR